jgi:predicted nucleic acid-binding protein
MDCSAVLALCFEDEGGEYAEKLLEFHIDGTAIAPEIWPLEVSNSLLTAVKRKRLAKAEANHFFRLVASLPIEIVAGNRALDSYISLFELASLYNLSSYDASYLALAMDRGFPLATLDQKLIDAADSAGVEIFGQ